MKSLTVLMEQNGSMTLVGFISGTSSADACFQYDPEYLMKLDASPVSVSLPLQEESFSVRQTAAFFEGLLPEGFTRRSVAQWLHADESDYLPILHALGRECLGAICITEKGDIPPASYEPVTDRQVRELAAEGAVKSAEIVTKSHLSLTGASGKVGLYYDKTQKAWYLPKGTAPSTHIVKQSHIRLDSIIANEQLCLMTAARCGIPVCKSFIINTGNGNEDEILFATERYDRILPEDAPLIDNLHAPLRLHQEDMAQAMGIPSSEKYEKNTSDQYLKRMFDLLRHYSADPITDQLKLWDLIVFNYLIGNTDAHIKNFALLYGQSHKSICLAPAYDIVSTSIYRQSTRDMAFYIGNERSLDNLHIEHFREAASIIGIGEKLALLHYDKMCDRFEKALNQSSDELSSIGFDKALDIKERILKTGGIASV